MKVLFLLVSGSAVDSAVRELETRKKGELQKRIG
jgi:hypothetical protein